MERARSKGTGVGEPPGANRWPRPPWRAARDRSSSGPRRPRRRTRPSRPGASRTAPAPAGRTTHGTDERSANPKIGWTRPRYAVTVGMPSWRSFPEPPGLGIFRSRTGSGRNVPAFTADRRSGPGTREPRRTPRPRRPSGRPRRACSPPVTRDPFERHQQRGRVVYEVEQIVEPSAGLGRRPTVNFGLHLRYPPMRPEPGRAPTRRRYSPALLRHCSFRPFSTAAVAG